MEHLHLVIIIVVSNDWKIKSLDIKSAFLQGQETTRKIHLKPPKEAGSLFLWLLNKTVYGLGDASREWYLKLKDELLKCGCLICIYDEALFFWMHDGVLHGIIACHVDDFLYGGSDLFHQQVIAKIKEVFCISKEEEDTFKYLGLQVEQSSKKIIVHQQSYINGISKVLVEGNVLNERKLVDNEYTQFRTLNGQIAWTSTQTRPDIAFEACQLSVAAKNATVEDLKRANKTLKELKGNDVKIIFPNIGDLRKTILIVFSDASFANLINSGSQEGLIIFLVGENGSYAPLVWKSKKVKRVVKSTLAAETLSLLDGAEHGMLLASILSEIVGVNIPVKCITDNKSLCDAAYSTTSIEDKRLRIDLSVIREMVRKKEITIEWRNSNLQLAGSLTKKGCSKLQLLEVLNGNFDMGLYNQ